MTNQTKKKKTRKRRTDAELIADLQERIVAVKERAKRKEARKDPALRHISAAVKSIDKALAASEDKATREALQEARATLTACLSLNGTAGLPSRRRAEPADPDAVLRYVQKHPGVKAEEIASALGVEGKAVSPVLKQLKTDERVRTEGAGAGTTYFPS